MTRTERKERLTISLVISLSVFAALFIAMAIVAAAALLLLHFGLLHIGSSGTEGVAAFVLLLMTGSLIIGSIVSWLVIRMPLGPVNKLITSLDHLASGKYDTRIRPEKTINYGTEII